MPDSTGESQKHHPSKFRPHDLAPAFTTRLDASHLALTLPSSALRLRLRSFCLFAPALIAPTREEQDPRAAAATRSDAPGTVRRSEMDDIVHRCPSRIGRSW